MESLNGKEPLSEYEEETLVGEEIGEIGEVAYWKAKAEEWRNVALESRLELEEFQNESRYKGRTPEKKSCSFGFCPN